MQKLIENGDFNPLIDIYEKKPLSESSFQILSYLYRLTDQYPKEKLLLDQLSELSAYALERKAYHELPLFEQMEPRPALNEEPEPEYVPSKDMLDNLCFVTIGSPEVYSSMVQAIESVKAIKDYADIPFYVIGLPSSPFSEEYTTQLKLKYGVNEVKYPNFYEYIPEYAKRINMCKKGVLANYIYPYVSRMVSEKYIVFVESDVWIKNRSCIDKMLYLVKKQGIAMPSLNMGLHAYDKEIEPIKLWQEEFRTLCHYYPYRNYTNPKFIYWEKTKAKNSHQVTATLL